MNWTIGDLGHLFVVISFIASLLATASYLWAELSKNEIEKKSWFKLGNISFIIHGLSVFGIVASLFTIIYTHDYRFHYAWSHSSNHLAAEYMISCFWEGQEGSFLLWIFWHVILGFILLAKPLKWQAPIMVVFCGVQAFLASMILGSLIGDFKLGSSPFILLREAMPELPIFGVNPNYVPEDGRGLNPLLQNYWMVIHPPTLFLGFA
ncbi:MAG: cytochrome C biogenesis protein, partial [Flexibacteraceae bacterium]